MKKDSFLSRILTYILFIFFYFLYIFVFKIRNKIEVVGKENLPKRSFGIVSWANHDSYIDSLPIRACMMNFWDMLFHQNRIPYDVPDYKNFYGIKFKAFLVKHLRNVPVKRKIKDLSIRDELVKLCCRILRKWNIHFFFEGGRTINEIRPCITSLAEIILNSLEKKLDFIFIPIFIDGMKNIMPREIGQKYLKMKCGHKVTIIIGKKVDFSDIAEMDCKKERKIYLIKKRVRDSVIDLKPNTR